MCSKPFSSMLGCIYFSFLPLEKWPQSILHHHTRVSIYCVIFCFNGILILKILPPQMIFYVVLCEKKDKTSSDRRCTSGFEVFQMIWFGLSSMCTTRQHLANITTCLCWGQTNPLLGLFHINQWVCLDIQKFGFEICTVDLTSQCLSCVTVTFSHVFFLQKSSWRTEICYLPTLSPVTAVFCVSFESDITWTNSTNIQAWISCCSLQNCKFSFGGSRAWISFYFIPTPQI